MKKRRGQVSRTATLPTPTGGWNARDAYDQMGEADAITLINLFPQTTSVALRGGQVQFATTGSTAPVSTLAQLDSPTAQKIVAATGGAIYDVTSGTGVSLGSGFVSDVWGTTNFSGPAGTRLLFFNGTDTPQIYDGASLTASTIASAGTAGAPTLNPVNLFCPVMYAERLFVAESGSMHIWYAQTGAYQGTTLNFLDMGAYATKGGTIAAIGIWTRINVYGQPIPLFVVVSTEGEVFIFQGIDPSNASDWSLQGQVAVGPPVSGARCIANLGSEAVLICQDGFQPLSQYLTTGQFAAQETSLSAKIGNAVLASVQQNGSQFGWEACLYPVGNRILFNVPQGGGVFQQYVMNTITKSWCQYTGVNAYTFLRTFGGLLYFGGANGTVYQAETGTADLGANISFTYKSKFTYPAEGFNCFYKMVRPVLTSATGIAYALGVDVDFADTTPTTPAETLQIPGGVMIWGVSKWGQALWGSTPSVQRSWQGVGAIGYSAAVHISGATMSGFQLHSVDVLYEPGGVL